MAAQHKRPGKTAKEERKRRAAEREELKNTKVVVGYPRRGQARDDYNVGRLVIWAEVVQNAERKKEKSRRNTGRGQYPERRKRAAQGAAGN